MNKMNPLQPTATMDIPTELTLSPKWAEFMDTETYRGAMVWIDELEPLIDAAYDDDAEALLILLMMEKKQQSMMKDNKHAKYWSFKVDHSYEDDNYELLFYGCAGCEETVCDFRSCTDLAFNYLPELLDSKNRIRATHTRFLDGFDQLHNDTILVLFQGLLSLKGFNTRVRRIYEKLNPGETFKGWVVDHEWENNGLYSYSGSGYLHVAEGAEDAVGIALANLANEVVIGKFTPHTGIM